MNREACGFLCRDGSTHGRRALWHVKKQRRLLFAHLRFFFVAPTHLRHFAAGFISHWLHLVSVNTVMVDPQDTADTAAIHPVQVENRP